MRARIALIAGAAALAVGVAGCGPSTPAEACKQEYGDAATAVPSNDDDERYCVLGGRPVGEVEDGGALGWEIDD